MKEKYGIVHTDSPVMELTTMIGCPLMCTFCPQKELKDSYGKDEKYLSLENLAIILSNIPQETRIDFSGMAEPWANKKCTDMLAMVLNKGFKTAIYTTLYGFRRHDTDAVKELCERHKDQIEVFCIHLPDASQNMLGWKFNEDWEYAYKVISQLRLNVNTLEQMTMDKSGYVHPSLQSLVTKVGDFHPQDRAGSLKPSETFKEQGLQPATSCNKTALTCRATPFYDRNVVFPNGDVVICCMDYNRKHILGNLLTHSMEDIRNGDVFNRIISINTSDGYSSDSICKSCNYVIPLIKSPLTGQLKADPAFIEKQPLKHVINSHIKNLLKSF
jgi:radical SAM protein with 4Fe4S-binding SPASM domain